MSPVSMQVAIAAAGVAKLFLADVIESALLAQREEVVASNASLSASASSSDAGQSSVRPPDSANAPVRPRHVREALRRLRVRSPRCYGLSSLPLIARLPTARPAKESRAQKEKQQAAGAQGSAGSGGASGAAASGAMAQQASTLGFNPRASLALYSTDSALL